MAEPDVLTKMKEASDEDFPEMLSAYQATRDRYSEQDRAAVDAYAQERLLAPPKEPVQQPGAFQAPDVAREDPNTAPQEPTASEQAKEEPPIPPPA